MSAFSNDNAILPPSDPDPHGQAAMLLVESLMHGLVEQNVISTANAVEIVDVAITVKSEIGAEMGDTPATLQKSINLLKEIGDSFSIDLPAQR